MMNGSYAVVDILEQILSDLADLYPPGHFGGQNARDYMNAMTAARFEWHRAHLEPDGHGKNGTMVGPLAAGHVIADLERSIEEMVDSLLGADWDLTDWKAQWRAEPNLKAGNA